MRRAAYRFIQVRPERFFGTEKVWIGDARVAITDLERTLLDGLSMPQCCGDFSEVLHAFEIGMAQLDVGRIGGSWRRESGPASRFELMRLHTSRTGRTFGR